MAKERQDTHYGLRLNHSLVVGLKRAVTREKTTPCAVVRAAIRAELARRNLLEREAAGEASKAGA